MLNQTLFADGPRRRILVIGDHLNAGRAAPEGPV
jgi:hypothetical protein